MGTTIRPELSEKNPYWIEKHRYYELKHFCLQYPIWRKAYSVLDGYSTTNCTDDFSGYLTRSGNDMKIVDKAVKKVYRFNCPNCQSRLEGESKEFEDIGGKISKFFCPVCKKDRYITWSDLRKKTVYEGENTQ